MRRKGENKLIFDGHGDIWTDVTVKRVNLGEKDIFRKYHIEKFRKGNVSGGIFVIWLDPPYDKYPEKRSEQIVQSIKDEFVDAVDILQPVRKFSDFEIGNKKNKINVVIGMEGMSQIGVDIDKIDYYYHEVGVRHAMLTWNEQNELATGWTEDAARGLTNAGRKAVKRIQNLGMVLDVSHLNDKSFWDVMKSARGPVIASHSNVRKICPVMRNLSDEMLKEIAQTGGLVGMNSLREFIHEKKENQDVEHLVDHIEYLADLIGVEHIGLGFDFDDYLGDEALSSFSANIESPSGEGISNEAEAKNVLDILKKRGFQKSELEAIAYKNYYRIFEEVWK
ncbi:MAG: membrane dipeptidase [Lachnospiraceae bacterium]|nr:membrane dipeptidase [Lachnospiraceae bacterium]